MIPKPGNRLLRYGIAIVAGTVIVEDGKLILGHHISLGLCLDPSPDIGNIPLKHCRDSRGYLAILIILGYLESFGYGELTCR